MDDTTGIVDSQGHDSERLAVWIADVRTQLAPIRSRTALLDSYRREALNVLLPTTEAPDAGAVALEIAYMLRWLELPEEQLVPGEMN